MARRRRHHHGLVARMHSIGGCMAERAVYSDALDADGLLRKSDRQFASFLRHNPERFISAGIWQLVRKDARQYQPDPIRHARGGFGPDRPIKKVLFLGSKIWWRKRAEKLVVCETRADHNQYDCDRYQAQLPLAGAQRWHVCS